MKITTIHFRCEFATIRATDLETVSGGKAKAKKIDVEPGPQQGVPWGRIVKT
jgi:hypothetical protein